ncbi:hypothetical protein [Aquipuribacter nitratireducens]|uniref:Uncharacterized protein n=1 Tax=Aquipuribacter nitratireducens TaxID=650104 RepID=A0ABW0GK51_9MICO
MADDAQDGVLVHVEGPPDGDAEELAELVHLLRQDLLDLDVDAVDPVEADSAPEGAKGVTAAAGWLAVQLGPTALKALVRRIAAWASPPGRSVEIVLGDDTLKVTGLDDTQQQRLIDEWLERQAARA